MDLEDTEKILARARQREGEISNENHLIDSVISGEGCDDVNKEVPEESVEISSESEKRSLYPMDQLRRLSEQSFNQTSDLLSTNAKENVASSAIKEADRKDPSKRRSVFSDLAANIDNFEFDSRPKNKTFVKTSTTRLSCGETRASALFTPNVNYYAGVSVGKSPKPFRENLDSVSEKDFVNIDESSVSSPREKGSKTDVSKDANDVSNCSQPQKTDSLNMIDENVAEEFGDEKQTSGLFESTTIMGSPSADRDKKESNIKKFFEKQSCENTFTHQSKETGFYEPSPILKTSSNPIAAVQEQSPFHSEIFKANNKRKDIVDVITAAALDATKGLDDLPPSSGRAKEIAMKLEEKAKCEISTPLTAATAKRETVSNALKKTVLPTTDVHIHYRLSVPVVKNAPRAAPVIDTTPANVKSLRSRWEVSSSSGAPLHPDQDEDDLLEAARKMSRAVKQSNQLRSRPQSYYESSDIETCEKNPPENLSQTKLTPAPIMQENFAPTELIKEDEKTKKRMNTSGDDKDDANILTVEKKPKREDNDETKLSGQLIGEALGAFEFLNETPTQNSSILSSIFDNTSELQTATTTNAEKNFVDKQNDNDDIPLVHSVSFYRKKKKELKFVGETTVLGEFTTTPPHCSCVSDGSLSPSRQMSEGQWFTTEKQRLEKAILVQEEQISQASKAFTLCRKNLEFRGSRMEVDAQRALLIATERRRALIFVRDNLLQAYSRGFRVQEKHKPRGTLTIKDISLRLMRDFINGHVNYHNDQMLYYFIVLIRHEETVHHTAMITSDEGLQSGYVAFPNYIQLKSLPHDFVCTLEVYALPLFSFYSYYGKLLKHQIIEGFSSPGATAAILDPSFQKIGKLNLNIGNITKTKFHLGDVMSPLDGAVTMALSCFPEETGTIGHKGFLSLYQEVEGIASWTRFWCVLNDGNLSFWKYPEEETTKKPVVCINLRDSACEEIKPLAVETCPYPHSIFIDIWIETAQKKKRREKIRIMMAADTKEDMHRWLTVLNESLRNITLWYPRY